jgi:4-hydroxyphenylpyruvate dioxygenase
MAKPELEVAFATVRQASFQELARVSAAAGFQAMSVNMELYEQAGMADRDIRPFLADVGMRVSYIDGLGSPLPGMPKGAAIEPFRNWNGRDVSRTLELSEDEFYRAAEALGAEAINVVHFAGDPFTPFDAMVEAVAGVCERAGAHGLGIAFEFLPGTGVPTIEVAAQLAEQMGAKNFGILFDTRHWARGGGKLEDLASFAPLISTTQISDLKWATNADPNRLLPGEGELPLAEALAIVRRARPDVRIGIETPSARMFSLPANEAASLAAESLRTLLAAVETRR